MGPFQQDFSSMGNAEVSAVARAQNAGRSICGRSREAPARTFHSLAAREIKCVCLMGAV